MERTGEHENTTASGYVQNITPYQAIRCTGCPLRGLCHKGDGERVIKVNHDLRRHKARMRDLLTSEDDLRHRSARLAQVGQAFANLKANRGFRRFLCRGMNKVSIEFGLSVIAHNISKTKTARA